MGKEDLQEVATPAAAPLSTGCASASVAVSSSLTATWLAASSLGTLAKAAEFGLLESWQCHRSGIWDALFPGLGYRMLCFQVWDMGCSVSRSGIWDALFPGWLCTVGYAPLLLPAHPSRFARHSRQFTAALLPCAHLCWCAAEPWLRASDVLAAHPQHLSIVLDLDRQPPLHQLKFCLLPTLWYSLG
jgi:hypothetical protein